MYERLESFLLAKQARYRVLIHHGAVTAQEQAQSHTSGWKMRSAEFRRIADPRVGDFAAPEALLKGCLKIPRRKAGGAAGSRLASGR